MYGKADAIYYYVQMFERKNQSIFECRVANCMKLGSVVIPCGSSEIFRRSPAFKRGDSGDFDRGNFHVKIKQIKHVVTDRKIRW